MVESNERRSFDRRHPSTIPANTNAFHLPTATELQDEEERLEDRISFSLAEGLLLAADLSWAFLSFIILNDFRIAIVPLVVLDAILFLGLFRREIVERALLVIRGLAGILLFAVEVNAFNAGWPLIMGQVVLLIGAVLLVFGRGGEGRNVVGAFIMVIGLGLGIVLTGVYYQGVREAIAGQFQVALELASVGRYDEASEIVGKVIADNQDNASVHLLAANYFSEDVVADTESAIKAAERAALLGDRDERALAYFALGFFYAQLGEWSRAIENLTLSETESPDNPAIYMNRAMAFIQIGRTQDALNDLRNVEKISPDSDYATQARMARLSLEGLIGPSGLKGG